MLLCSTSPLYLVGLQERLISVPSRPGILGLIEIVDTPGGIYLVSELMEGAALVESKGHVPCCDDGVSVTAMCLASLAVASR